MCAGAGVPPNAAIDQGQMGQMLNAGPRINSGQPGQMLNAGPRMTAGVMPPPGVVPQQGLLSIGRRPAQSAIRR